MVEVNVHDLSITELARLTGRHPETLRQLARLGRLAGAYKLGGKWAVAREAVDELRGAPTIVRTVA